jgi:hypothetical protein
VGQMYNYHPLGKNTAEEEIMTVTTPYFMTGYRLDCPDTIPHIFSRGTRFECQAISGSQDHDLS